MKKENIFFEKSVFEIWDDYDKKPEKVVLTIERYCDPPNLAIDLDSKDGPYTGLTVNLGVPLPPNMAFIDTNNNPEAPEFLGKYGLAKFTGGLVQSGYCVYPLYEFDMNKLKEAAPKDFAHYIESLPENLREIAIA